MKDPGAQHNGACIRVNIPDHSKDKMPQDLRRATEIFLKKVMAARVVEEKENEKWQISQLQLKNIHD